MIEILFYFLLYAFGGWILENIYSWKTTGTFLKENFLKTPIKPMYGIAPVLLIYGTKLFSHWLIIAALCLFVPSIVEYMTGTLLDKYFGRKWWDYSGIKFQLHGHVCLHFSLCWMILCIGLLYFVQPMVADLYDHSPLLKLEVPALMSLVAVDMLMTSFKRKRELATLTMKKTTLD